MGNHIRKSYKEIISLLFGHSIQDSFGCKKKKEEKNPIQGHVNFLRNIFSYKLRSLFMG